MSAHDSRTEKLEPALPSGPAPRIAVASPEAERAYKERVADVSRT